MSRGLGYLLLAVVGVGLAPAFARAGCGDYLTPSGLHDSMPSADHSEKSTPDSSSPKKKPCNGWNCGGKQSGAVPATASLSGGGGADDVAGLLSDLRPFALSSAQERRAEASLALQWFPFTLLRPPRFV